MNFVMLLKSPTYLAHQYKYEMMFVKFLKRIYTPILYAKHYFCFICFVNLKCHLWKKLYSTMGRDVIVLCHIPQKELSVLKTKIRTSWAWYEYDDLWIRKIVAALSLLHLQSVQGALFEWGHAQVLNNFHLLNPAMRLQKRLYWPVKSVWSQKSGLQSS